MNFNIKTELEQNGFTGFKSVEELWMDKSVLPRAKGVYLVLDPNYDNTEFLQKGVGGFFKGKNPNVPIGELKSNLVPDSLVVYIGKAGSPTGKATLYSRLGQYLKFGEGDDIGHYGGRFIWQLKNHTNLIFCWKKTPREDPREVEKQLITDYINQFGTMPFANLKR
jgi:hypothetical protein